MTRPETRYARSGELAIAYQVHGSGDRDLLVNTGISSNVETIWDIPEAARYLERLGRFARVIRFDRARHTLQRLAIAEQAVSLADLAVDSGYYDQAHLAREFRELAGCAPSQWLVEELRNVQASVVCGLAE